MFFIEFFVDLLIGSFWKRCSVCTVCFFCLFFLIIIMQWDLIHVHHSNSREQHQNCEELHQSGFGLCSHPVISGLEARWLAGCVAVMLQSRERRETTRSLRPRRVTSSFPLDVGSQTNTWQADTARPWQSKSWAGIDASGHIRTTPRKTKWLFLHCNNTHFCMCLWAVY